MRFVEKSRAGLCHVNMPTAYKESQFPFGVRKDSGAGPPEAGEEAIGFFTEHKAVYIRYGQWARAHLLFFLKFAAHFLQKVTGKPPSRRREYTQTTGLTGSLP